MTQTYETNYRSTLAVKLEAAATSMIVGTPPTVTAGRLKIGTGENAEWVSFTGVSSNTITGLTRGLSKTADPATSGTGKTHIAGTVVILVAMHDQLDDKQQAATISGAKTFTAPVVISGSTTYLKLPSLTTAQRDSLTASNGFLIYNSTTNTVQQYIAGAWSDVGDTGTPNASTTVAGKVEASTQAQTDALTPTGETGALLFTQQDYVPATTKATPVDADFLVGYNSADSNHKVKILISAIRALNSVDYFGDASDGDVTIAAGTTTLTRDMYYNDLQIDSGGVLQPNGYKIFVNGTLTGDGKIQRNGNAGTVGASSAGGGIGGVGGAGGVILNTGSLGDSIAGGLGGNGGNNGAGATATNGAAGASANPAYTTTNGVAGGAGGATGSPGTGGAGGTSTRGPRYNEILTLAKFFGYVANPASYNAFNFTLYKTSSAAGGGGGGAANGATGGSNAGGGGGGGGTAGGLIWVAARTINWTGTFESIGGAGGNGGTGSTSGSAASGGGGGGGGNGGVVYLIYTTLTSIGTTTVTAGSGGTGGAGAGGGATGVNGTVGNAGTVIQITV